MGIQAESVTLQQLSARYDSDAEGRDAAQPAAEQMTESHSAAQPPADEGNSSSSEERWSDDGSELAELEEQLADWRAASACSYNAGGGRHANRQQTAGLNKADALQPAARAAQSRHIHTGQLRSLQEDYQDHLEEHVGADASAMASVRAASRLQQAVAPQHKDKADRATSEQVLDPRTRMVLFKMLNSGLFAEVNGCISTGKEANVYHACTAEGRDLAIKVYKTSILVFKDRDRYVRGDFRFKQGLCRGNPRKMVKGWAEKEMRNLARLRAVGLRAPAPLQLRMHVLAMEFIGSNGVAAPRLKDARAPLPQLRAFYADLVLLVRALYQECRLVHADLSEYNILVHAGELWLIDVSQSVDLDHPRALDFLREDAAHVNAFFRRAGVATLTTRELFDFAVDPSITPDNVDAALSALQEAAASRPITKEQGEAEATEHRLFAAAHIPRRLEEVEDYEEHHERLKGGVDTEGIYYQGITGMKADMSGARLEPAAIEAAGRLASGLAPEQSGDSSESGSESDSDSSAVTHADMDGEGPVETRSGEEQRADRKAHKREVKEANRERRKHKLPKKVKKKAERKGKRR